MTSPRGTFESFQLITEEAERRWLAVREAVSQDGDVGLSDEQAREIVYGMPYSEWKEKHQTPATPEQLAAMDAKKK